MGEPVLRVLQVMDKISQFLKIVFSVVFLHYFAALPANSAESGPWKAAQIAGDVLVQKPGADWRKLSVGDMVSVGQRLRTGRTGELILARDEERVTMTPNSVLEVQPSGSGMVTSLFQKAGTMMFKVRKKARKHFEVRTPYLVAVVKGTQFTVTVHDKGGAVHVTEGLVEVADFASQNKVMVHPGKTASIAATKGSKVQLGVTPSAKGKKGVDGKKSLGKQSRAPKLMQPIGIAKVNINKRTKGLLKRRNNPAEGQIASRGKGKSINVVTDAGNANGNPFDKTASNGLGNAFGLSNGNNGNGGGNGGGNGAGGGHGNGNGNNGNGNGNNGNGNGNNGNGNGNSKK